MPMTGFKVVCGAKRKHRDGDDPNVDYFCQQMAGLGTDHPGTGPCKFHFGCTPAHNKAAEVERAKEAVKTLGLPVEIDPQEAILQELHRTTGAVAFLQDVIAQQPEADLVQFDTSAGGGKKRVVSAWMTMYQAERGHLVRVAAEAVKCGVAQRQVEIAEQQGLLLAEVIKRILVDLDVFALEQTPEIVRRHMLWADRVLEIESESTHPTGASSSILELSPKTEATAS